MNGKLLRHARLLVVAGALVGTIGIAVEAGAQGRGGRGGGGHAGGGRGRQGDGGRRDGARAANDTSRINRQLSRLTQELTLTASQQTSVRAILVEEQNQMKTLRDNEIASNSTDREAHMTQMKGIRDLSQQKISGVLTAAQKTKFDQLRADDQKRFGEGRGRRGQGSDSR